MWQVWIELPNPDDQGLEWRFWGEYRNKYMAENVLEMLDITYPKKEKQVRYVGEAQ